MTSPPREVSPGVWMPGDDFGWIGETKKGIWIKRHPSAALAVHAPELWRVYMMWRSGIRELTPADLSNLTAVELEAMMAMSAAEGRAREREFESGKGTQGVDKT